MSKFIHFAVPIFYVFLSILYLVAFKIFFNQFTVCLYLFLVCPVPPCFRNFLPMSLSLFLPILILQLFLSFLNASTFIIFFLCLYDRTLIFKFFSCLSLMPLLFKFSFYVKFYPVFCPHFKFFFLPVLYPVAF